MLLVFDTFNTYFCLFIHFLRIDRNDILRYKIYKNMKKSVKTVQYILFQPVFSGLTDINYFFMISLCQLLSINNLNRVYQSDSLCLSSRSLINFLPLKKSLIVSISEENQVVKVAVSKYKGG
jgi:hypothetical protein